MKKILFPTDFSPTANNAFIYALQLADKIDASITTLHVYNQNDFYITERGNINPQTLECIYESIDMDKFENYRDAIPALRTIAENAKMGHIEIHHVMEEGPVIPKILKVAKEGVYDLIVMGTKGAGWIREVFLGTVTAEVMERATCPVFAVPEDAQFDGKFSKIAMATEYKNEEREMLNRILELTADFDAHIYLLNVDVAGVGFYDDQKKAFMESFKDVPRLHFKTIEDLDILSGLNDYLEEHRVDVICMMVHKRNFFQELFKYSLAKTMTYHSKTPILSFQAHAMNVNMPPKEMKKSV